MTLTWNRVLLLIAVVLFLLATLVAGGIVSGSLGWAVPGGLTAFALAFLLPLEQRLLALWHLLVQFAFMPGLRPQLPRLVAQRCPYPAGLGVPVLL